MLIVMSAEYSLFNARVHSSAYLASEALACSDQESSMAREVDEKILVARA